MKLLLPALLPAALLAACGAMPTTAQRPPVDNLSLPEAVRAPAGAAYRMTATGRGELTYECREKAAMAGQYEWVFVAPAATLHGASGQAVGRYYGGPTWEASDGSKVTGKQVAVAPAAPGSIPLQLVKAEPAMGAGAMQGVGWIQRVNTRGGVAPSEACDAAAKGRQRKVDYSADYVFYGA